MVGAQIVIAIGFLFLGGIEARGIDRILQAQRDDSASVATPSSLPKCPTSKTVQDEPPKDPNADAFGFGNWYVNADRTIWVRNNRWRAGDDGNKVIWIRPVGTHLVVTGRRVDAEANPIRVTPDRGYPTGFTVITMYFPSEGCWEITVKAGNSELRFVTEVASVSKEQPKVNKSNCPK